MSEIDRQKRMTNLLLAGNLATNHRSTKILGEMRNIQSQQLQTDQKRNVELQKQSRLQEESLRQQRQENLIRKQKLDFEEQKHKKAENEIKKTKHHNNTSPAAGINLLLATVFTYSILLEFSYCV